MSFIKCTLITSLLLFTSLIWAKSPPWWTFHSMAEQTLGKDPCIKVLPNLTDPSSGVSLYTITIQVCDLEKAKALATIMSYNKNLPGYYIATSIKNLEGQDVTPMDISPTDLTAVQNLLTTLLKGNPLFVTIHPEKAIYKCSVEFSKTIVQFWDDNLADYYRHTHMIASDAFAKVLGFSNSPLLQKISVTTSIN